MPKAARRPDPEPLETDDRPVLLVAMAAWVFAFVVLVVFFRDDLRRHHATYWLWSCGIGVAMGLYGLHFIAKVQRARKR
jgi:NO-binding membrane sensor protein with MHYT domain